MALTVNGSLLGLISASVIQEKSLGYLLAGIIPHGIFELPAFIIGEAAALNFGTAVILALFIRKRREMLPSTLKQSIKYLAIAFTLLIPAAFIETYITPLLLR
jgi:stage II sporulation protein M